MTWACSARNRLLNISRKDMMHAGAADPAHRADHPPISLQGYGAPIQKVNLVIERYAAAASGVFLADWFGHWKDEDDSGRRIRRGGRRSPFSRRI